MARADTAGQVKQYLKPVGLSDQARNVQRRIFGNPASLEEEPRKRPARANTTPQASDSARTDTALLPLPQRLDVVEVVRQKVEAQMEQRGDGPRLPRSAPLTPGFPLNLGTNEHGKRAQHRREGGVLDALRGDVPRTRKKRHPAHFENNEDSLLSGIEISFRAEHTRSVATRATTGGETSPWPQNAHFGSQTRDKTLLFVYNTFIDVGWASKHGGEQREQHGGVAITRDDKQRSVSCGTFVVDAPTCARIRNTP